MFETWYTRAGIRGPVYEGRSVTTYNTKACVRGIRIGRLVSREGLVPRGRADFWGGLVRLETLICNRLISMRGLVNI